MPQVYGQRARPRMLLVGFPPDDQRAEAIAALVPTSMVVPVGAWGDVSFEDWDLAITFKAPSDDIDPSLYVIAFGGGPHEFFWVEQNAIVTCHYGAQTPVREFKAPDLDGQSRDLVDTMVPQLIARTRNELLTMGRRTYLQQGAAKHGEKFRALVVGNDDSLICAFGPRRETGKSEIWFLPWYLTKPEDWVRYLLYRWSQRDAERFPIRDDWRWRPRWMTAEQHIAFDAKAAFEERRARILAELSEEQHSVEAGLASATEAAAGGLHRLMTARSSELVDIVADALMRLGFLVESPDAAAEPAGKQLLEDLRVRDPDDRDWVSLVEVRAYTSGAKTSDFQRIGRFLSRWERVHGHPPSAAWYIVNQFCEEDPDDRPPVMVNQRDDVETFAESGGLVMDTLQLFSLVTAVEMGRRLPEDVRHQLRAMTGYLSQAPAGDTPPAPGVDSQSPD